jgi:hypothetical protein
MIHRTVRQEPTLVAMLFIIAMLFAVSSPGCQSPRSQPIALDGFEHFNAGMFLGRFIPLKYAGWIEGEVDAAFTPEGTFVGEQLRMRVLEVNAHGARIAFHVGEDASRTWIITRQPDGRLHLRHDHRDPDGTPHELTDYGGYGFVGKDYSSCSFAADEKTAAMLPEAATNVWTMTLDFEAEQFIYNLTRHGRPRFRAVFDLARPQPSD